MHLGDLQVAAGAEDTPRRKRTGEVPWAAWKWIKSSTGESSVHLQWLGICPASKVLQIRPCEAEIDQIEAPKGLISSVLSIYVDFAIGHGLGLPELYMATV